VDNRNAYFQFSTSSNGTYLKIFPPVGNGAPIKIEEIVSFCLRNHIKSYKMMAVNEAVRNMGTAPIEVHMMDEQIPPISESIEVKISGDRMRATCKFYPPSAGGHMTDKANVLDDIRRAGVVFGIDESVIDRFLENREYCKEFVIATGREVREGEDAVLTYNFNTKPSYRPTEKEDGTVDFHNLNFVNNVHEGDVLATLKPADLGDAGKDVVGGALLPKKVKNYRILAGKNTKLSEDGCTLYSTVNGHVILDIDGKVVVSDVLEIKGDIDTSTGDIKYDGSIVVRGNVKTGYTVEATGNIDIDGVVEGATVISGGDVALRRGIQGMNRAYLKAEGNLMAKFIENAKVVVSGNIESGSIMNSQVISKKEIFVRGRRGVLVGGNVRAGLVIDAQNIGSGMGSTTKIAVGIDAETQDRMRVLHEELKGLQAEEYRTRQLLEALQTKHKQGKLSKEHLASLPLTVNKYSELKERIIAIDDELFELSGQGQTDVELTRIKVRDRIYPGVSIEIQGEFLNINDEYRYCQFMKKDAEIKRMTL